MLPDDHFNRSVARLLYSKLTGDRRFVSQTGARGFRPLTRSTSRVGTKGLATVGTVTGGLRFSTPGRLVVIERGHSGYRVLVRAQVAGEVLVLLDEVHVSVDSIREALLDALSTLQP